MLYYSAATHIILLLYREVGDIVYTRGGSDFSAKLTFMYIISTTPPTLLARSYSIFKGYILCLKTKRIGKMLIKKSTE